MWERRQWVCYWGVRDGWGGLISALVNDLGGQDDKTLFAVCLRLLSYVLLLGAIGA